MNGTTSVHKSVNRYEWIRVIYFVSEFLNFLDIRCFSAPYFGVTCLRWGKASFRGVGLNYLRH